MRETGSRLMQIALFEPDIAQNTGTILRLCACLGIPAHIVGPAGFPTSDRAFRRAGMDYLDQVTLTRHDSWSGFDGWRRAQGLNLVLLTTRAATPYLGHRFTVRDVLLLGRESAGVPEAVHASADTRLVVPMRPGLRSLNVAMACAMVAGEALRQTGRPANRRVSRHDVPPRHRNARSPQGPRPRLVRNHRATRSARPSKPWRMPCLRPHRSATARPAASCARRGSAPTIRASLAAAA